MPRSLGPQSIIRHCLCVILANGDVAERSGFVVYQPLVTSSLRIGQVVEILADISAEQPLGILIQGYQVSEETVKPYDFPSLRKLEESPTWCPLKVCCPLHLYITSVVLSPLSSLLILALSRNSQCYSQLCCSSMHNVHDSRNPHGTEGDWSFFQ